MAFACRTPLPMSGVLIALLTGYRKRPDKTGLFLYGAKEIRTPDPNAASVVLYQTEL